MAFQANNVRQYGLGKVKAPTLVKPKGGRKGGGAPKLNNDQGSALSISGGEDAGMSDTDIKLRDTSRRLSQAQADPRYHNPDGSKKSTADIQKGFADGDAAKQAASDKTRMRNFSLFSDYITSQEPDKDGYVTLDEETIGRLPSITKGFTGRNNPKKMQVRDENGYLKVYGDGKPLDIMSPKMAVVGEMSRFGSVIRQQEAGGNKTRNGKLNDQDKSKITSARNELKRLQAIQEKLREAYQDPMTEKGRKADLQREGAIYQSQIEDAMKLIHGFQTGGNQQQGKNYDYSGLRQNPSALDTTGPVIEVDAPPVPNPLQANQVPAERVLRGRNKQDRVYYENELSPDGLQRYEDENDRISRHELRSRIELGRRGRRLEG